LSENAYNNPKEEEWKSLGQGINRRHQEITCLFPGTGKGGEMVFILTKPSLESEEIIKPKKLQKIHLQILLQHRGERQEKPGPGDGGEPPAPSAAVT